MNIVGRMVTVRTSNNPKSLEKVFSKDEIRTFHKYCFDFCFSYEIILQAFRYEPWETIVYLRRVLKEYGELYKAKP